MFFTDFLYNNIILFIIRIKNSNEVIGKNNYPYESDNISGLVQIIMENAFH